MNFELTSERKMLSDSIRRTLEDKATEKVQEASKGFSSEIWEALTEIGVGAAAFGEDAGGFGGSGFDLMVVFEQLGCAGAVTPLMDTAVLAGSVLASATQDDAYARVEDIIAGAIIGFAHLEPSARYQLSHVETKAAETGGWVLSGRKSLVGFADSAEAFVVTARTSGGATDTSGISIFLVPGDTPGLTLRSYPTQDGGRASEMVLEDVTLSSDALICAQGEGYETLRMAVARATCAICSEAVGLMNAICDMTVDYLKNRRQFGQPIGKFQVLQHRMADVLIEVEQARSAVVNLAGNLDGSVRERELHVSAAKNLIGRTAKLVVEEAIQMHGGIGMTEEYALGHLAKRLTMIDHRFGDVDYHLARFMELRAA